MQDTYINSVVFTSLLYIVSGGMFLYSIPSSFQSASRIHTPKKMVKLPDQKLSVWTMGDLQNRSFEDCVFAYFSSHGLLIPILELTVFWLIVRRINWVKIVGRFLSILAVIMDFVPVKEDGKSEITAAGADEEYMQVPGISVAENDEEIAAIEKEIAQFKEQLLRNNIRMKELQAQRDEEERIISIIKERCNARARARTELLAEQPAEQPSISARRPTVDGEAEEDDERFEEARNDEDSSDHDTITETFEPAEYNPAPTSILKTTGFTSLKHVTFEEQEEAEGLVDEPLQ